MLDDASAQLDLSLSQLTFDPYKAGLWLLFGPIAGAILALGIAGLALMVP